MNTPTNGMVPHPNNSHPPLSAERVGLVTMIISAALCTGTALFGGVVFMLRQGKPPEPLELPLIVMTAFSGLLLVMRFVMPVIMDRNTATKLKSVAEDYRMTCLAQGYVARSVVTCAIPEGIAMKNLVLFMIAGQMINLIVAGCMLLLMTFTIPSQAHFQSWSKQLLESETIT